MSNTTSYFAALNLVSNEVASSVVAVRATLAVARSGYTAGFVASRAKVSPKVAAQAIAFLVSVGQAVELNTQDARTFKLTTTGKASA